MLSRLTDIALADGALMDAESAVILDLAHQLGLPSRAAYRLVIGAAQAVGFRSDVKLNRMSEEIRRGLQAGFRRANGLHPPETREPVPTASRSASSGRTPPVPHPSNDMNRGRPAPPV